MSIVYSVQNRRNEHLRKRLPLDAERLTKVQFDVQLCRQFCYLIITRIFGFVS